MASFEKDEMPMLSGYLQSDNQNESRSRRPLTRATSALISMPMNTTDSSREEHNLVGFTGPLRKERTPFIQMSGPLDANRNREVVFQLPQGTPRQKATEQRVERYPSINQDEGNEWHVDSYMAKNEHLLRSGQLGMCNDPYCTTCPTYYHNVKGRQKQSRTAEMLDAKFHNMLYGDAKGWAKRMCSFLLPYIPGVMNPHSKFVQRWNKFFVISCLLAVFLDPLFFFLLYVQQNNKCIVINWPMTTTIVVLRSLFDLIYMLHMYLQFRLAYVAPESTVVGAGELVDDPKKIAKNYLCSYFFIDLFVVLPVPQIIILLVLPESIGASGANYAKNLLRTAILIQYIPRLFRFLPLAAGTSATGFTFESAWAHFVINFLTFVLASHVVGSCWYLFGLQRVDKCFRKACNDSTIEGCREFIDCGHGTDYGDFEKKSRLWELWKNNENASACFVDGGYDFGIYKSTANLTTHKSFATRYIYSLFWGFQQISTLAGNQVPSYYEGEVLFTMAIIGIGLLLFALLIGNMQNFLQSLGRRGLEMSLRRRDVELWMSHRRLPENLRRQVRDAERFNWAATRGVNEEKLMENLPEDLQRDIRRHLFKFIKKVRIFQLLDEPVIDAICERLRTKTYINCSKILFRGGLIDKMVFIIRGKMESIGEDQNVVLLSEGDVCGEELLTWCLEHSSVNKDGSRRLPGHGLLSNRTVKCTTNVEVFVLRSSDLEEVTSLFARFLRSPRVQGAIRYESHYWRGRAARQIQVAWRYRKKRINRGDSSSSPAHN
ncbi:probable cyclic nucleotide-gated ion channel 20, chloroplastic isoform X2 [Andrographis paniculata]|nr:probable cyclic nucleotide-gated ion channel 20, chloroplastic isoform X2 [Andrographis paniculata]